MRTRSLIVAATFISLAIGVGAARAENPAPAASDQPAAAAKMSPADKAALAKSCIDQANAKGLHGKARKKFKRACKHGSKKE